MDFPHAVDRLRTLAAAASIPAAFALAFACESADPILSPAPADAPAIVNGEAESGYPAVGALVYNTGGGSYSAFCTATLIDPSWVLTAAHCVSFGGKQPGIYFFVGTDDGDADSSNTYGVEQVYVQDDYVPDLNVNDIALVELSEPVDPAVAEPIPANTASIDDIEGELVFYVGFGTSTYGGSDSGEKRSTDMELWQVGALAYTSRFSDTNTGICSGDSGGPGLYDFGDGYRVIGVNSTVQGTMSSSEMCEGYYNDTRVDAFGTWIAGTMEIAPPDCSADLDMCLCDEACEIEGGAGVCDNAVCATELCGDTFMCYLYSSTMADQSDCIAEGAPAEVAELGDLWGCVVDNCASATTNEEFFECFQDSCGSELEECCEVSLCDLLGGDCDAATACRPSDAYNDIGICGCVASDGAAYGESCDATASDPTSCGDGMLCLNTGGGAKCHQLCREASDCTLGGGDCQVPTFPAPNNDVGYCLDDFTADTDSDTGTDTDTDDDAGADADADSDTDADAGTGGETPQDDCGCDAPGASGAPAGLLSLILG